MPRNPESRLTDKILDRLRSMPGTWWVKLAGGAQQSGLTDILGVVSRRIDCPHCGEHVTWVGQAVLPEVKHPQTGHPVTPNQWATIVQAGLAGAATGPVWSVEDAVVLARARSIEGTQIYAHGYEGTPESLGIHPKEIEDWSEHSRRWRVAFYRGRLRIVRK